MAQGLELTSPLARRRGELILHSCITVNINYYPKLGNVIMDIPQDYPHLRMTEYHPRKGL